MRKLLLSIVVLFLLFKCRAQVTLEKTYLTNTTGMGQEFFLTNLGGGDYKYVIYDYDSAVFSLYNLDHSPYLLNISVPLISNAANSVYYRLGYVTKTLFDCDSTTIEYALMLNTPQANQHPNFAIYRVDGLELFSKDTVGTVFCVGCGSGSYEMHPIMNTPEGAKLYLYNYNIAGHIQYFVYGLCDKVPAGVGLVDQQIFDVKAFPNPTSGRLNFEVTTPSSYEKYDLKIFSPTLQLIKQSQIVGIKTQIDLESALLATGTYFYTLEYNGKVVKTGKFIYSQ